eukprot:4601528-Amphidinium_carterae.1
MDTYLDCNYLDNYLAFTSDDSEWLQEAYISYIGGKKHTVHERRTTNQIRSVEASPLHKNPTDNPPNGRPPYQLIFCPMCFCCL